MCRSAAHRALLLRLLSQRLQRAHAATLLVPSSAPKCLLSKPHDVWGCRRSPGVEYVLDYMVERKRCDDLVSSVRDQRYAAQKYRMRQSGLRNLFYLLEGDPDITREPAIAFRRPELQRGWALALWEERRGCMDVSSQLLLHGCVLSAATQVAGRPRRHTQVGCFPCCVVK